MDTKKVIPIMLAIMGLILLSGGVAAHYGRAARAAACEACGMEVERSDSSTFTIVTQDGVVRYGCCPMCSLMIGIFYRNAAIGGKCFECGREIKVNILNADLSEVTPIGAQYNVSIILGNSCATRKIVCSPICAQKVKTSQNWAKDLPLLPVGTAFQRAKETIPRFTIMPRQVRIPEISYILVGLGATLLALSPISWKLLKRRSASSLDRKGAH